MSCLWELRNRKLENAGLLFLMLAKIAEHSFVLDRLSWLCPLMAFVGMGVRYLLQREATGATAVPALITKLHLTSTCFNFYLQKIFYLLNIFICISVYIVITI